MLKSFSISLSTTTQRIVSQIHGFSSAMNFMFFIYVPLVHSASHTFITTYTRLNGRKVEGIPEIYSLSTLDARQIDYYDSEIKKLKPRQDWMKQFASSGDKWKKYSEIRERVQQMSKQFSQSHGVHMYERVYGCVWEDETEDSHGFDEYSYDGQEFISLDLKESRYTAHVPQAEPTVLEWNNDKKQLGFLTQYYQHECTDWLKELLKFSKATFEETGQSLREDLQKNLTVDDPERSASDGSYTLAVVFSIILVVIILILLYTLCNRWKKTHTLLHK